MNKKVFISYCWGNTEHQEWIVSLATRLMNDTVDVILDRWSLKDGHDIHSFMEEMVKAEDVFRVLIVSNKKYSEKADDREGGVGTETQIITPNIYSKEKQEKFIPIVLERDESQEPYLPVYLKSRKYIDFSKVESFENSYEELLRNILEAPSIPKPKLGTKPPEYITDASINISETSNKLKTIENQLAKNGKVPNKELLLFIEIFSEKLWEFEMPNPPNDLIGFGEALYNTLKSYRPLREDFIKFIDILSSNEVEDADGLLIDFFESAPIYESPREETGGWKTARYDIFKIIFHELFLYTIAVSLKNKNYSLVADLLQSPYYKKEKYRTKEQPSNYAFLRKHHENLENYSSQQFRKITGFGDYVITNLSDSLKKMDMVLADTLCYFVSFLDAKNIYSTWFPYTYLYGEREALTFFDKLTSQKHFEKAKAIFNVNSSDELKEKLVNYSKKGNQEIMYGRSHDIIPFIHQLIKPETIAIFK